MTPIEDRPDALDARFLDRLVDGGLSGPERCDLLLRLDADPEGWRRCALAFLEDQAWRQALGAHLSASLPAPVRVARRPGRSRLRRASLAASLLAATFAGGFASRGLVGPGPVSVITQAKPPSPVNPPSRAIREVGSFELVDASAGETPPQRFPIRSGPGLDERWLREQPPTVPDYVRARWESEGYQVAERRRLMTVGLGDGREVSIPVDEVEVRYVGQQPL